MKMATNGFIKYISIYLLIYATDSFVAFANIDEMPRRIFQIVILLGIISYILFYKRIEQRKAIVCAVMVALVGVSITVNNDYSGENIVKIFLLIAGMLFCNFMQFEEFSQLYIKVMFTIACVSLVVYPFSRLIVDYSTFLPRISNMSTTMICLFITNVEIIVDGLFRNAGPFWEPGVYAIYLCLALIMSLRKKDLKNKMNIVFILTIITTISTTGMILLVLIMGIYIFLTHKEKTRTKFAFLLAGLFLAVLLLNNDGFMALLTSKLDKNNYTYMSTQARLLSISGNANIFLENAIFGAGSIKYAAEYADYATAMGAWDKSNTNALIGQFAMYGALFGFLYLWALVGFSKRLFSNKLAYMCLAIVLSLMLFAEPLQDSFLFNTLIFYGIEKIYGKKIRFEKMKN